MLDRSVLAPALRRVTPDNDQGEYYLTDVVEVLHDAGYPIVPVVAGDDFEDRAIVMKLGGRRWRRRVHHRPHLVLRDQAGQVGGGAERPPVNLGETEGGVL